MTEPTVMTAQLVYAREHLAQLQTYWPEPVEERETQAAIVATLELVCAIIASQQRIWDALRGMVQADRLVEHAEALLRRAEEGQDATL